ncbi:hypothetical protein [Methylorubrum aminovorans]|nr:hypothetical protein [Methylorubrum aminovorans]
MTTEMHSLRFPFLSSTPFISQLSGLRGLFQGAPRPLPPSLQVAGSILETSPGILCFQPRPWPFGLIYHFAARFPDERLIFLQPVTMSLERPTFALSFAIQ